MRVYIYIYIYTEKKRKESIDKVFSSAILDFSDGDAGRLFLMLSRPTLMSLTDTNRLHSIETIWTNKKADFF